MKVKTRNRPCQWLDLRKICLYPTLRYHLSHSFIRVGLKLPWRIWARSRLKKSTKSLRTSSTNCWPAALRGPKWKRKTSISKYSRKNKKSKTRKNKLEKCSRSRFRPNLFRVETKVIHRSFCRKRIRNWTRMLVMLLQRDKCHQN